MRKILLTTTETSCHCVSTATRKFKFNAKAPPHNTQSRQSDEAHWYVDSRSRKFSRYHRGLTVLLDGFDLGPKLTIHRGRDREAAFLCPVTELVNGPACRAESEGFDSPTGRQRSDSSSGLEHPPYKGKVASLNLAPTTRREGSCGVLRRISGCRSVAQLRRASGFYPEC